MIVFDLQCTPEGHRFEGWFGSSGDYADQQARGLLACPVCGSAAVGKAVMAPAVGRKGNQAPVRAEPDKSGPEGAAPAAPSAPAPAAPPAPPPLPPEAVAMLKAVVQAQAEALKRSTWVGDTFADEARAMHYGDKEVAPIHGQATPGEARDLLDEGIEIAPLLVPVVPPEQAN
jgi:hypothetical protein